MERYTWRYGWLSQKELILTRITGLCFELVAELRFPPRLPPISAASRRPPAPAAAVLPPLLQLSPLVVLEVLEVLPPQHRLNRERYHLLVVKHAR